MVDPSILFENDEVIVINKPSGMIVYPDGKHDYPALSSWLTKTFGKPALLQGEPGGEGEGFHFVHRIDRETSGVLVVAKSEEAHQFLKEQFQERDVRKVYRAFVYGFIKEDRGIIERPIGNARGGKGPRSATRPHGHMRDALTMFTVLRRVHDVTPDQALVKGTQDRGVSYVEVRPKTGRTHQIRVHFSAIQRPILCDQLYAPTRAPMLGFKRLALHALSLSVTLPRGEEKTFIAPLPEDFVQAEETLQKLRN